MKSLGQVFGLFSLLFFGHMAIAIAQPSGNQAESKGITLASQDEPVRRATIAKLERIRLPEVRFEDLSLEEVVRQLNDAAKKFDPEKTGVVFSASTNSVAGSIEEVGSTVIGIPSLTDIRLADLLDGIVLVADKPIKYSIEFDGSVVFSARPIASQLYSRAFKVYPDMFASESNQVAGATHLFSGTTKAAAVSTNACHFIENLGVDLKSPSGKTVFYNDRLGKLFVKATQSDLDKIEKALSKWQSSLPQIHIKARFVEVPKTEHGDLQLGTIITNSAGSLRASFWQCVGDITNAVTVAPEPSGWMCILTRARLFEVMKKLQSRNKGIEALAEPEVTTLSGSQTQMRATQIRLLDTNYGRGLAISGPASIEPLPQHIETGSILDLVPNVLSDGFTVNLAAIPSFTELMSSVQITNTLLIHTDSDVRVAGAKFLTLIRGWQVAANVNLWDGQTVVIGGLPAISTISSGKPDEMELLVFITATIVDPAGNRVHADDELPFAKDSIPPQPPQLRK